MSGELQWPAQAGAGHYEASDPRGQAAPCAVIGHDYRAPLEAVFFRDCGVSSVRDNIFGKDFAPLCCPAGHRAGCLESSSCIPNTRRFCAGRFLALTKKSEFSEMPDSLPGSSPPFTLIDS